MSQKSGLFWATTMISKCDTMQTLHNHCTSCVRYYANIAQPLYKLRRQQIELIWSRKRQDAFERLKTMLTTVPVLRRPDSSMPYILHTDWSPLAIGAVLEQIDSQGQEHPVVYGGKLLRGAELKYAATQGSDPLWCTLWSSIGLTYIRDRSHWM